MAESGLPDAEWQNRRRFTQPTIVVAMTDAPVDAEVDTDAATDPQTEGLPSPASDGALGILVDLINRSHGTMTMTFFLGAGILSGTMISLDEWVDRWVAELGRAKKELGDAFQEEIERAQGDRTDVSPSRNFLFMRDAHLFQGPHARTVALWRGRMSQIDGWALGAYSLD